MSSQLGLFLIKFKKAMYIFLLVAQYHLDKQYLDNGFH